MPKKPMDYSRTIIYQICCKDLLVTDVYVGHTTDFIKRKCQHKGNCNNEKIKEYKYKIYQIIRANGNWDNWDMIEIEKYPCNDGNEARARERYWYETLNANMNIKVPNRSKKEYKKEYNKTDNVKDKNKEYYETNKEEILEKLSKKNTCECGSIIRYDGKARHLKTQKHIDFNNLRINLAPQDFPSHIVETELVIG